MDESNANDQYSKVQRVREKPFQIKAEVLLDSLMLSVIARTGGCLPRQMNVKEFNAHGTASGQTGLKRGARRIGVRLESRELREVAWET